MASKRSGQWEENDETYSPEQVRAVLRDCGIDISSETQTHYLAYCPFHGNSDTPAFEVDKYLGLFICFNPSCGRGGNLIELVRFAKRFNVFQAMRLIAKNRNVKASDFAKQLSASMEAKPTFVEFEQSTIDDMVTNFAGSVAEDYMHSRGFEDTTLKEFEVGFSARRNMVAVPMHDPDGMPIGIIGRTPSHKTKQFKNSYQLPKSKTAWNFHRAKKTGDVVIVCEASYDAMRIHQAGYDNVIALLGGSVSDSHVNQINKSFSKVIIMTDFDAKQYRPNCKLCNYRTCQGHRPGRVLGRSIISKLPNKEVRWAVYDDSCVFPHGAKDASDMTDEEIRKCIKGSISNLEYSSWGIEN